MLLLQQMIVLFFYMVLGYYGSRKGVLDSRASKVLSWIVVNVANPGMVINSAVGGDGRATGRELVNTAVIAVIMYVILLVLAQLAPIVFRASEHEKGIYKLMTTFNNIGFMGFPVIAAVYGNEALLYAAIFTLPFNVLIYTYGIAMVRGEDSTGEGFQWRKILNVGVVACLIAVVLYLASVPVPQFVKTTVSGLSGLTAPLSMMVIGISLSAISLKELFLDVKLLVYAAVKLLIIPIIGTLIIRQFVSNELLVAVCMIMLATPVASMSVMLAQQYDRNVELASKGVAITTLLSVVTIPLVSAIVL
ncbi:MAG: AEC family transporter [Eubacteriales bacterium]|nr:AEC family transporter [Eubacteriales bacterium]